MYRSADHDPWVDGRRQNRQAITGSRWAGHAHRSPVRVRRSRRSCAIRTLSRRAFRGRGTEPSCVAGGQIGELSVSPQESVCPTSQASAPAEHGAWRSRPMVHRLPKPQSLGADAVRGPCEALFALGYPLRRQRITGAEMVGFLSSEPQRLGVTPARETATLAVSPATFAVRHRDVASAWRPVRSVSTRVATPRRRLLVVVARYSSANSDETSSGMSC